MGENRVGPLPMDAKKALRFGPVARVTRVTRVRLADNIVKYGPDRVKQFCADNHLKLVVRAHECVQDGYQYFASCHLITVRSPGCLP